MRYIVQIIGKELIFNEEIEGVKEYRIFNNTVQFTDKDNKLIVSYSIFNIVKFYPVDGGFKE